MSWQLARDQIISIIEGTTPRSKARGYPAAFKYRGASDAERLPQERGFWIEYESGHMVGPMSPTFATWLRAQVVISVRYGTDLEVATLQNIMMEDYSDIMVRIANPANWNRPTSTIVAANLGTAEIMPFKIEKVDGATLLQFLFTLDFKDTVQPGGF